jgi:DNA-binding LytR/AlgR family response regulator
MIKVVIIEDEAPARRKLLRFLGQLDEDVEVIAEIDSVRDGILFFQNTINVDLILSDIELLDGTSIQIFKEVNVTAPIIFTTAYDQFWMDAFETNGIEYLLKPFSFERFERAWKKFKTLKRADGGQIVNQLINATKFKNRFTIKSHKEIYFIETSTIVFFQAESGAVFAWDNKGKRHVLQETTLKEIEAAVDPASFYRLNRSDLVQKGFVEKVERYSKNAIALKLKGYDKMIVSSQTSTAGFWKWIEE